MDGERLEMLRQACKLMFVVGLLMTLFGGLWLFQPDRSDDE